MHLTLPKKSLVLGQQALSAALAGVCWMIFVLQTGLG